MFLVNGTQKEIRNIIEKATLHAETINLEKDLLCKHIVSENIIAEKLQERIDLAYVINSVKEMFYLHGELPHGFFITDEVGYVLFTKGIEGSIKPGMCLNNDYIGPNGVGFALQNRIPVKVKTLDNYQQEFKNSITYGAPIIYDDKTIGVVGFEIAFEDRHKLHIGIMENIVAMVITMAKKMLDTKNKIDGLNILNEYSKQAHRQIAILAINYQNTILHLNNKAEQVFQISSSNLLNESLDLFIYKLPQKLKISPQIKGERFKIQTEFNSTDVIINTKPIISPLEELIGWIVELHPIEKKESSSKLTGYTFDQIIGNNHKFNRIIKLARIVSNSTSSVLINGESGTGKELLAQAIHNASPNAKGQFVAINSSAIPRDLMESELFGYVEGAFTGAKKGGMQGKLLQANNGTLFLDEIGDMPLELQPKLLRVIQEQQVTPIGGRQLLSLNVRFIAATNQNLELMINEKTFRADLYYRLNVIEIRIPPLRERQEDIPLLVDHFIQKHSIRSYKNIIGVAKDVINLFKQYNWPGNIRELENAIEMAVLLADGEEILLEHLPERLLMFNKIDMENEKPSNSDYYKLLHKIRGRAEGNNLPYNNSQEPITPWEIDEKDQIIKALNFNKGNVAKAARKLGISRATMYRRLETYKLMEYVKSSRRHE